jgi:hypothetical protein
VLASSASSAVTRYRIVGPSASMQSHSHARMGK